MNSEGKRAVVEQADAGKTVAAVVRELLCVPWSRARSLCATGRVRIDGAPVFESATRVRVGATVVVDPTSPRRRSEALSDDAILHVDHDIVVVNKPPGVPTVPFAEGEQDTLLHRVRLALARGGRGATSGRKLPLRVVQRLDKDTSGVLVFARNRRAERSLQDQLRRHSAARVYVAMVNGRARSRTHDTVIVPDRGDGLRGSWGTRSGHRGPPPDSGKRAVTHVRVDQLLDGATLVWCRLETGRQHQIRIHLGEAGNPVVGERVYIRDWDVDRLGPLLAAPRTMLHARVLELEHPATARTMTFDVSPPDDFCAVLARLRGVGTEN